MARRGSTLPLLKPALAAGGSLAFGVILMLASALVLGNGARR